MMCPLHQGNPGNLTKALFPLEQSLVKGISGTVSHPAEVIHPVSEFLLGNSFEDGWPATRYLLLPCEEEPHDIPVRG
jgi:hypothetical protein